MVFVCVYKEPFFYYILRLHIFLRVSFLVHFVLYTYIVAPPDLAGINIFLTILLFLLDLKNKVF